MLEPYRPRDYWTEVAREIEQRSRDGSLVAGDDTPFYRYKRRQFVRRFLTAVPVSGASVLELGCGPGGNLIELSGRHPRRLVGCDISPTMVKLARTNLGNRAVEVAEVDGSTLPFGDREFDVSFTVTVLQHNHEETLVPALRELCRVTGSWLYLFEDTGPTLDPSYSYVLRPPSDYASICEREGFVLHKVDTLGVHVTERLFHGGRRKEGAPVGWQTWAKERLLLPMTSVADRVLPQRVGLSRMVFQRVPK